MHVDAMQRGLRHRFGDETRGKSRGAERYAARQQAAAAQAGILLASVRLTAAAK